MKVASRRYIRDDGVANEEVAEVFVASPIRSVSPKQRYQRLENLLFIRIIEVFRAESVARETAAEK